MVPFLFASVEAAISAGNEWLSTGQNLVVRNLVAK
jgi:hypothetical protein